MAVQRVQGPRQQRAVQVGHVGADHGDAAVAGRQRRAQRVRQARAQVRVCQLRQQHQVTLRVGGGGGGRRCVRGGAASSPRVSVALPARTFSGASHAATSAASSPLEKKT